MTAARIGETAAQAVLTPAERLVLWGVRTWVAGACTGTPLLPAIDAAFRQAMAAPAVPALDSAMTLLIAAVGPGTTITVHGPQCPALGDHERLLLDVLALHQAGEGAAALFLTRALLPPAGARLAGPALRALATELLACGLRVPDRRGAAPVRAALPVATHHPPSTTLH
ncbi:hypothetical protein [Azospirillum sp. ST 5-10]|uniref:hypothetical protein n=1 Tax=unclassified Azospirillum TaxID=2630922 RepID=UPI003F4A1526